MSWALNPATLQSATNNWYCITSDVTGSKLWAGLYTGDIWLSTDGGTTWTPTGDPLLIDKGWTSIASDASGINICATANGLGVYVSNDGGVTWALPYTESVTISGIASDASGVNLYVATSNGILISKDGGASWTRVFPTNIGYWIYIACSSDGTRVFAICPGSSGDGPGWYSMDGGSTWNQMWSGNGYTFFNYIDCDSTGTTLIACGYALEASTVYKVWLSTDSGVTFTDTGLPSAYWTKVKSDSTGTTLVACGTGAMYVSKNSGATWTQKFINDTAMPWYGLASDSTGTNLAAVAAGGDIWTSNDGGSTWTAMNVNPNYVITNYKEIRSDSTGSKLVTIQIPGYIYTSSDTGTTWIKRTNAGYQGWVCVTSDSTGLKLVACVAGGDIWRSTDGGATWTPTGNPTLKTQIWSSITSDSMGSNLAACVQVGDIWLSIDGGATWTPTGNPSLNTLYWTSITSDSTGLNLAACVYGNYIYISKDGGATWTPRGPTISWYGITSDATGSNLVACTVGQQDIWHSRDGGDTWTPTGDPSVAIVQFVSIASDARGINVFAGAINTGMWQSLDGGSTWSLLSGTSGLYYTGATLNAAGTLGAICGYSSANVGTATFTPPSPILPPPLDSQITGDIRPEVFETSIKYNWTAPASGVPEYYTLVLSPNPGGSPYTIGTFKTSYTVTGVTPGQSYEAYMTDTAYGDTSDPTSFRTVIPGNVPGVPQDISANFLSATSAIVNWTQPVSNGGSPVQWYVVVATPADLVTPPTYKSARGYNSSRIIDGLDVQDYSFSVVAINDPGYSQYLSTPVITNPGVGP